MSKLERKRNVFMEHEVVTMEGRQELLIHNAEWYYEVLSENIRISVFLDKLLDKLEQLTPKRKGKYDLEEIDSLMTEMPEIKHEPKIKAVVEDGVRKLHKQGKKAYEPFYETINELLNGLTQAESLFVNEMMKMCGETEEEMFHKDDDDEDD